MRLIDADELKEILIGKRLVLKGIGGNKYALMAFDYCIRRIDEVSTIEAVPMVHGEWIVQNEGRTRFKCSNCRSKNHEGYEKFCPNCGAKMDEKAESH